MNRQKRAGGGYRRPLPSDYAHFVKKFSGRVQKGESIIQADYVRSQYAWMIEVMEGRSQVA